MGFKIPSCAAVRFKIALCGIVRFKIALCGIVRFKIALLNTKACALRKMAKKENGKRRSPRIMIM